MDWHWYLRLLTTSAFIAGPAISMLAIWLKRGIESRTLYRVSWANPIGLVIWLCLVAVIGSINESMVYRGWIPRGLPASVFFGVPFLCGFCSLILCGGGVALRTGERLFASVANGLMLVLWFSAVAAPNCFNSAPVSEIV